MPKNRKLLWIPHEKRSNDPDRDKQILRHLKKISSGMPLDPNKAQFGESQILKQ